MSDNAHERGRTASKLGFPLSAVAHGAGVVAGQTAPDGAGGEITGA